MSKALRTAALVVGGVALVATGVGAAASAGLLGAAAAGAAGTIAGVSVATISAVGAIAGAVSAVAGLAATALAKTPGTTISGNQTKFTASLDQGIPWAIGITGTAGCCVHDITFDANGSKNNTFQTFFGAWSGDRITSVNAFQVDGNTVNFALDPSVPTVPDNAVGAFHSWMWFRSQLGTESEALKATGFYPYPSGWSPSALLAGMGAFSWTLKFDSSGKTYPSGIVPQERAVIAGAPAWDPRLDDTYPGGQGACRLADPSTWPFTENPFLLALRWALGIFRNGRRVMGIGMALTSVNVDSAVQCANIAQANGFKVGGVVYSTDPKYDVLKKICMAASGEPLRVGGRLQFVVDAPRVSLDTITNADIIGKCTVPSGARMKDKLNGCIPTYRAPDHDWQLVPAAKVTVDAYVQADGRARTKAMTWELVQDAAQVAKLATYAILNSREIDGIVMPLRIRWVGYKPGDAVQVASSVVAMDSQQIVFRKRSLDPGSGAITFTCRTETAGKHPFALGQTTTPPPTPALATQDRTALLIPGISASWTHIADDDPVNNPRATWGAPSGTPVGTMTADQVIEAIDSAENAAAAAASDASDALNGVSTAVATAGAASQRASAALSSSLDGALNANSVFADWPDGQASPTGWHSPAYAKQPGRASPYSVLLTGGQEIATIDYTRIIDGAQLVLELDIRASGPMHDFILALQAYQDDQTTQVGGWGYRLSDQTPIDNGGNIVTTAVNGEAYRYRIFVDARVAGARQHRLYAGIDGGSNFSCEVDRCCLRLASAAEIKGNAASDALPAIGARINDESDTRANETGALATRTADLEAQAAGTMGSGLGSRISDVEKAGADAVNSVAQRTLTLEADINGANGQPGLAAQVSQVAAAVVGIDGKLQGYLKTTVQAGGASAEMTFVAVDDNGNEVSTIILKADNIILEGHVVSLDNLGPSALSFRRSGSDGDTHGITDGQTSGYYAVVPTAGTFTSHHEIEINYYFRIAGGHTGGTQTEPDNHPFLTSVRLAYRPQGGSWQIGPSIITASCLGSQTYQGTAYMDAGDWGLCDIGLAFVGASGDGTNGSVSGISYTARVNAYA